MDLPLVVPNRRFGRPPSWKISNDHISGMSYPIHFHELQSSFGGIQEKIVREEYLDWSQSKIFLVMLSILVLRCRPLLAKNSIILVSKYVSK